MKLYEGLFAIVPDQPEAKKTQLENIEALIKKHKGKVAQKTEWGKKPLGFLVKKNREADFVIFDIEIETKEVEPLRRAFELQENLLRYMLTVKNTDSSETVPKPVGTQESKATSAKDAAVASKG